MLKVTTKHAKVKKEKEQLENDMDDLRMMMMNMMAMHMPRVARHSMKQQENFDGSIITKEQHKKGSSIQTLIFVRLKYFVKH